MPVEQDIVTNPPRIASILKSVIASRCLMTITLPGLTKPLSTTVLDLTGEGLLLDEMVQTRDDFEIGVGSEFTAFCKNKGVPVVFRSKVNDITTEDENTYYVCDVPEYVKYSQKRTSFRLPTHGDTPALALRLDGDVIESQTLDISEGGAKVAVESGTEVELESEHQGTIYLDELRMPTGIRVCHVRDNFRRG